MVNGFRTADGDYTIEFYESIIFILYCQDKADCYLIAKIFSGGQPITLLLKN
jgi:hypothetical protein